MFKCILLTIMMTSVTAIANDNSKLTGTVKIDGSSTVYPITEAVAEEFAEEAPRVRVTVGISGTGGGFKRFSTGETDISDASRPIKAKEQKVCKEAGIEFIEVPVAYDGLTIVVNRENTWCDSLTVEQLKQIFLDGSTVMTWKDLDVSWPEVSLKMYAPGTDSGTFDYFKEVVAGKKGSIRSDMSVSEDDNVLVRGVSGDKGGIGFFGCAYYFENKEKLKTLAIYNGKTNVLPNSKTIESGEYAPFSRPLFIYVNKTALDKPAVQVFVDYYIDNAGDMAEEVGYVRLPETMYDRVRKNIASRKTGTQFIDGEGEKVHGALASVYE
ncbi:MAG: PstS family phosphate ABC transporter substrate-binding protein [Planctomycetes bacterium]|nr:PstS family phosphate ABC transporter substrate-binding protein [Planctomycetota bacterium]